TGRAANTIIFPTAVLQHDTLPDLNVSNEAVNLYLPPSFFLCRKIAVPPAGTRHLGKIAELDLARRTPFRQDEVYWALSSNLLAGSDATAIQWIARKSDVELMRTRLAGQKLGLRKVFASDDDRPVPIADFSAQISRGAVIWRRANALLSAAIVAAGIAMVALPAIQQAQQARELTVQLDELRAETGTLRRDVEDQRAADMQRGTLLDAVIDRNRLSHVLRELTVSVPDTVWVSELAFQADRLLVSAEIDGSAAELVIALASDRKFIDPRLTGRVETIQNGDERFQLSLGLRDVK
ncbi:MAG: PilN domain-containing protein, partial [Albidovulum sp.]|uniref:PilN domain-containing protein n=1 Tax=Albidovulum sp. TaxID=1872424 RepID=UPI003CBE9621